VVLVVIAAVATRRLRRRPDPVSWAETGDNRLFGRPSASDEAGDQPSGGSRLWSASDWSLPREPDEGPVEAAEDDDVDASPDADARPAEGEGRPARPSGDDARPAADDDQRPAGDPPPGP
jgi:cytochrome c1